MLSDSVNIQRKLCTMNDIYCISAVPTSIPNVTFIMERSTYRKFLPLAKYCGWYCMYHALLFLIPGRRADSIDVYLFNLCASLNRGEWCIFVQMELQQLFNVSNSFLWLHQEAEAAAAVDLHTIFSRKNFVRHIQYLDSKCLYLERFYDDFIISF